MLEHTSFTFNNVSTDDLGLMMVQKSGGLYEETFISNRKINETSIYKGKKRYFKGVEVDPLSFTFSIWIKDWKDRGNLRAIARWLNTDNYAPLWFNDEPDKVYYCMIEGEPKLIHNGLNEGTIDVTFRCDSEYAYSHPDIKNFYLNNSLTWRFHNKGDATIYPYMKITQKPNANNRTIFIRNLTDNKTFTLFGVRANETVYIDCENRIIESEFESQGRYLYDNHNGYWLPFEGESNRESSSGYLIQMDGSFDIEFTFEYKFLQQGEGL